MNEQKRLSLAIALIVGLFFVYSLIFKAPPPKTVIGPAKEETEERVSLKEDAPAADKAMSVVGAPEEKAEEIIIETRQMRTVLTGRGAYIKEISLKKGISSEGDDFFKLLSAQEPIEGILVIDEFNQQPLNTLLYKTERISPNEVRYSCATGDGYRITKNFKIHKDNYAIDLEVKIENLSNDDRAFSYSLIGSSRIDRSSMLDKRFANIGVLVDKRLQWLKPPGRKEPLLKVPAEIKWLLARNAHHSSIVIPYLKTSYGFIKRLESDKTEGDQWLLGLKTEQELLAAGSSINHRYLLYAGPTTLTSLKPLGLEGAINYGKLDLICQILIKTLNMFYGLFHNYGLAIILLVVLINILIYPLTAKTIKSTKQMQEVQPHLAKLRDIHKDDQSKLQQEMMKLYREHKINPLGGCLPMFLQMPIFFALYITLARSAELRGSNFLWIKDLSQPDAIASLPFKIPIVNIDTLNILPIIMMFATMIQQKVSTGMRKTKDASSQEAQQQKMMLIMPIMFALFFYKLPSGLVLYWTTNAIVTSLTYYMILKRSPSTTIISGAND